MVANVDSLHGWHHDDYDLAKEHMIRQMGSLDGLRVFGRQVLVAVYVRPCVNTRTGLTFPEKEQMKDWYESKVVLVIAHGPEAFTGDESYLNATYPDGIPPKVGDWLFQNANAGIQISFCGDGAERVQYEDRRGEMQNLYPSTGWPVRFTEDNGFLGSLTKPHTVV